MNGPAKVSGTGDGGYSQENRCPIQPKQMKNVAEQSTLIPVNVMKADGAVEAQLHIFLASVLDRHEQSASRPSRLIAG